MLGFMTMTGVIGLLNIRNLQLKIVFPDEIYAGVPTQLALQLQCRGGLFPAYLLDVFLCGKIVAFPVLKRDGGETRHLMITFNERGRGKVDLPHVASPFPIGFFVRALPLPVAADFLVFPAPRRQPDLGADSGRRSRGELELARKGGEGELFSISDYSGSESLRQIHWRLSARHDSLKVKQFAAIGGEPVIVNLNELPGDIETRLGTAAYLINRSHRAGRPVGLKIEGRLIPPAHSRRHRLQLLGELALHDSH